MIYTNSKIFRKNHPVILVAFFLLLGMSFNAPAQEGHPLDGTWSGDRMLNDRKVRVLLSLKLLPDQSFEGMLIENGARIPLQDVALDPETWSVSLSIQGQNRAGEQVAYQVEGRIENLGSATQRMLVGTWQDGSEVGEFSLRMN